MSGRPEVLLVGHDASRTGAPAAALGWLRWAAADGRADVRALLLQGGPLLPAYEAACPTAVRPRWHGPVDRASLAFGGGRPRRSSSDGPVVVANTLATWPLAATVRHRSRLVVWVHELDHVAARILTPDQRADLLAVTDHLIAVGHRVAEMLVERWHVPAEQVTTVDSFLDAPPGGSTSAATDPPRCDVVGIGSLTPRKGPDAFAAVLAALSSDRPGLRAAWLGGPADGPIADLVRHDLAAAGLTDRVDLAGEVDDVAPWLAPGTVLLHPAREDPAPLAVLEAARAGLAVVTWDTGGAADLLRDAGLDHLVAPAGDTLGLARRLDALLGDEAARTEAGAALRAAAAGRTTDRIAPAVLDAVLGTPVPSATVPR